jgi:hypothetical protein
MDLPFRVMRAVKRGVIAQILAAADVCPCFHHITPSRLENQLTLL